MRLDELDRWLGAEQSRIAVEHPRFVGAVRAVAHRQLVVVAVLFVGVSLAIQGGVGPGADASLFVGAGHEMLSRHALQTYASPVIQTGPLYLVVVGLGRYVSEALRAPYWFGPSLLTSLAIGALVWEIGKRLSQSPSLTPPRRSSGALLAVGLSAAMALAASLGHPDDMLVGLVVILAADLMYKGSVNAAAIVLALAIAIKIWAVLAIGILALRGWRSLVRAAPVTLLIAAACYGPFIVFGAFRMFRFVWAVESDAPVSFFISESHSFPWSLRVLQAVIATSVGFALAYKAKSSDAVWLVPAAVIASRLLLDPRSISYYWAPIVAALAIGTWLLPNTRPLTRGVVLFAWVVPMQLLLVSFNGLAGRVAVTVLIVGVLTLAVVKLRPRTAAADRTPPLAAVS